MRKELKDKFAKVFCGGDWNEQLHYEDSWDIESFIDEHFVEKEDMIIWMVEEFYSKEQVLELVGEDKSKAEISNNKFFGDLVETSHLDYGEGYNQAKQEVRDKVNLTSKKK